MGYRAGAAFAEAGVRYFRRGIVLPDGLGAVARDSLLELVESLHVHVFATAWTLPHPQCRRALRTLALADEVERHVAGLRRQLSPAHAPSIVRMGDASTGNVRSKVAMPGGDPAWWAAVQELAA